MNGNDLPIPELNARRRQAVTLRLQGEKLLKVSQATGLSQPTVIAAVKAYRHGGWAAVDVSPRRGRPGKSTPAISGQDVQALKAVLRAKPSRIAGMEQHALWSRQALAQWLAAPTDYTLRYDPMLKAGFLAAMPAQARVARLEADLAFYTEQLAILTTIEKARKKTSEPDPRADVRAMAIDMYTALAKWCRDVLKDAKRGTKAG